MDSPFPFTRPACPSPRLWSATPYHTIKANLNQCWSRPLRCHCPSARQTRPTTGFRAAALATSSKRRSTSPAPRPRGNSRQPRLRHRRPLVSRGEAMVAPEDEVTSTRLSTSCGLCSSGPMAPMPPPSNELLIANNHSKMLKVQEVSN